MIPDITSLCIAVSPASICEAQLRMDYHRIEKGLSLPLPKRPLGASVDERLTMLLLLPSHQRLTTRVWWSRRPR